MKLPRATTVFLAAILVLSVAIEQAFTFPVVATMILFVQQPLLSDTEGVSLATLVGILVAVTYHVPFALGMLIFLVGTFLARTILEKSHAQLRDSLLTAVISLILAVVTQAEFTWFHLLGFAVYFSVVMILFRVWIRRKSYMFQKLKR
ncbi:hypothetical protein H3C66_03735 [Patescibacteria group bacterium]|nr:hypothetical protein [Patescibacteria group bacterium]